MAKSLNAELLLAASSNDANKVKNLLEKKADVNIPDKKTGQTALMLNIVSIHSAVGLLIDAKADVSAKDNQGRTAAELLASCPKTSVFNNISIGARLCSLAKAGAEVGTKVREILTSSGHDGDAIIAFVHALTADKKCECRQCREPGQVFLPA